MEVDPGIAQAARAVEEGGAQEPLAGQHLGTGVAAADEAGVDLEVALDLALRRVERLLDVAGVVG